MKKKITITSLHLRHGGVEKMIVELANAFDELKYPVEILCTYHLGEPAYPIRPGVQVTYLTDVAPNRKALKEAIQKKNPFLLCKETFYAAKVLFLKKKTMKKALAGIQDGAIIATRHEHALLLSKVGKEGVLKVAQLHSDHNFNEKYIKQIQNGYGRIDYFTLLTKQTKEEIEGMLRGHNITTKCVWLPNFIDEPTLPEQTREKQIVAAGRLHQDKDFAALLRIWARVCKTHTDWVLKIIGEGELLPELQKQAVQLGIEKQVRFPGAIPNAQLLAEMGRSYGYALTSVSESFGLVLVEAMAVGTPPVAFDIRVGPKAIIEEGETGYLVPGRDEALFAQRLTELMDDKALFSRLSENAKMAAKQYFKETIMKSWVELIET